MDFVGDGSWRSFADDVQMNLAHANRVSGVGQVSASIVHEVNQPIASVIDAQEALRWLGAEAPNTEAARQAIDRVMKNGLRAGDVVGRIRRLKQRMPPKQDALAIK